MTTKNWGQVGHTKKRIFNVWFYIKILKRSMFCYKYNISYFCVLITFNNPLKNHVFHIEKPVFNVFLKIIGAQNLLPLTFKCDCAIMNYRPPHTHEFLTFNIPIAH